MAPLDRLFTLEVEFQRKLRCDAPGTADPSALHTSYALAFGYESLLSGGGQLTAADLYRMAGDLRDVFNARDSLIRLLHL
jgi:hypothetical protein